MSQEVETLRARFDQSAALFEQAVEVFRHATSLYAGALAARARRRQDQASASSPVPIDFHLADTPDAASSVRRDATHGSTLTARQVEVATLIARGRTNAQIADELVVTHGTAANHVAQILERLGFTSRTQIAVWAIQQGLVESKASQVQSDAGGPALAEA